ncbi:uncharacterized protein LOC111678107 [Lucilia cuprina]|uniref:uncharacterized protein LOC111678107 n=1 Tax=Lucilia cuprina TaxID=7375 RepID=UPI001F067C37|nr:uncharacterized protein LOC111678107 [Lucilia cuprina]
MTKTVIKSIILLNILVCLTQAALVKNQVSQSQLSQLNNNYQQNSIEQPRFPSRTSTTEKERFSVNYDQVNDLGNRVLDNFDHRYPDGSYEFRYELADGQARYERGYFITVNKQKSLVVVGYYSYRMTDGKYITVFYNADRFGYRQNQAITRDVLPDLPRTIEVPEIREEQSEYIDITTKKSNPHPTTPASIKRLQS